MKKMLVAVAALAALVLASCTTSFSANDNVTAADVKAVASDAGVVVLSWENVADASGYEVLQKLPGTESFTDVGSVSVTNGRLYKVVSVTEKNAEYTFKVITKCGKSNVLASETEVKVTTAEEFKDVALDASKITVTKVPFTANQYRVTYPVDAGYTYNVKFVTSNVDAKVAFGSTTGSGASYDGAKYIKQTKTVNDEEIVVPAEIATATLDESAIPYYVVIKATPVNTEFAKAQYAISTASVSYEAKYGKAENVAATKETSTKARVTFTAAKVGKTVADASKYAIYRSVVTYDDATGTNTTESALTKLGTAKSSLTANSTTTTTYYYDDTIEAYAGVATGKAKSYNYYVVYEGDDVNESVWSTVAVLYNTTTGTTTATNIAATASFSNSSAIVKDNSYKIDLTIANTAKDVKVYYKAFATAAEANKAVAADLTDTVTLTKVAGAASTSVYSVDGVVTTTVYDSYTATLNLNAAVTDATVATATSSAEAVSNAGAYYVFRAVADGSIATSWKAGVKATVTSINGVTSTTYSPITF